LQFACLYFLRLQEFEAFDYTFFQIKKKNTRRCDAGIGWDGTFNRNPCEPGAYVYFILASDNNGPINVKGTVILIR